MSYKITQKEDYSKKSDLPSFLRSKQSEKTDDQKNVLALRMIEYLRTRGFLTQKAEWTDQALSAIKDIPPTSSQFVEKLMREHLHFTESDLESFKKDDIFARIARLRQSKADNRQDMILAALSGKSTGR